MPSIRHAKVRRMVELIALGWSKQLTPAERAELKAMRQWAESLPIEVQQTVIYALVSHAEAIKKSKR